MKHEIRRNKLVTQSGRNRESPYFLILTSQMQELYYNQYQKGPAPLISFCDIFIQLYRSVRISMVIQIWLQPRRAQLLPFSYSIFTWCQVLVFVWIRCKRYIFLQTEIRAMKALLDSWPQQSNILGLTIVSCLPFVHRRCRGNLVARWVGLSAYQLEPCLLCPSERYRLNLSHPFPSDRVRSVPHLFASMLLHRLSCQYLIARHLWS
jgi:hypothetical protein